LSTISRETTAGSSRPGSKGTMWGPPSTRLNDVPAQAAEETQAQLSSPSKSRSARPTPEPLPYLGPQMVSKEAAAAFWGTSSPPADQRARSRERPQQRAERSGKAETTTAVRAAKPVGLSQLLLPMDMLKDACDVFRRHADFGDGEDISVAKLDMSHFEALLCGMCNVKRVSDLPEKFVNSAFSSADRDGGGSIDLREFASWYSAFSFSEFVCLSKDTQGVRDLARQLGIDVVEIENYKKVFDGFDSDGGGSIDIDEFGPMLCKLMQIPAKQELPANRVKQLWQFADVDGGGTIDFEEFCVFYTKFFNSSGGGDPLKDFYSNVRKVP